LKKNIPFLIALLLSLTLYTQAWADPKDGLVAYYPFNGNADDESGNGNHGVVIGATLAEDRFGNADSAYNFDGFDDYIEAPSLSALTFTEITVSVWVKPVSGDINNRRIVTLDNDIDPEYYHFDLEGTSWRGLAIYVGDDWVGDTSWSFEADKWAHIAVTYDGTTVKIFRNGELTETGTKVAPPRNGVLFVGGVDIPDYGAQIWDGEIDEVRIYNRLLSDYEIKEIYNEEQSEYLLWQDQIDGGQEIEDVAKAVAVKGYRAFTAGYLKVDSNAEVFTVRAYNTKTGELLWYDQGEDGEARAIAVEGYRVLVAGSIDSEFTIRAYHIGTGELLWENRIKGEPSRYGQANAVVADKNRVFVAGIVNGGLSNNFGILAYNIKNGKLLWQDQVLGDPNGYSSAHTIGISQNGKRLFVAGEIYNGNNSDWLINSYNAKTGRLLWQDLVIGEEDDDDVPSAITVDKYRVFVAGKINGKGGDFLVRVHHAGNGRLLWYDRYDGSANGYDAANDITVYGRRAFVAGRVNNIGAGDDFAVRVYNKGTGELLWEDYFDGTEASGFGSADTIEAHGNLVFVGGSSASPHGTYYTIRAYRANTGKLAWQDHANGSAKDWDSVSDIAIAKDDRLLTVGSLYNLDTKRDFTVRAYKTK
jgi:WD40 repeat protein